MYFVAGASGRVGSVVARELLAANQPVTVLLRDARDAVGWERRGARVRLGTLQDAASLASSLAGAKAAFLLQPPSYAEPDFLGRQLALAQSVEQALRESAVPHVVLLSSVGAHLASGTGPIQGLHGLEAAIRRSGTTLSAFRACYFQENVRNALGPARSAGIFPVLAPGPEQSFPQISCLDVSRFIALAMQTARPPAHEVVDLVGPTYSHAQVASALGRALGKELRATPLPRAAWVPALQKSGLSAEMAGLLAEMNDAHAKGWLVGTGDRTLQGTTPIEVTIDHIISG